MILCATRFLHQRVSSPDECKDASNHIPCQTPYDLILVSVGPARGRDTRQSFCITSSRSCPHGQCNHPNMINVRCRGRTGDHVIRLLCVRAPSTPEWCKNVVASRYVFDNCHHTCMHMNMQMHVFVYLCFLLLCYVCFLGA